MNTVNGNHTHRTTFLKTLFAFLLFSCFVTTTHAQTAVTTNEPNFEHFGHTLNIGLGPGYFGASLMRSPYFTVNYEVEVLRNFTLAPFVGFATYRSNEILYGARYYSYRGTIMPLGVKAIYYFDEVIELPWRWDLYAGASLGYTIASKRWEPGYTGVSGSLPGISSVFAAIHVGAEYHVSDVTGIFLDLSNNVTTAGVGIHW